MLRDRPLASVAGRTDRPCSSRWRHFATLAQIIRVNLDAKMAASPSPEGRAAGGKRRVKDEEAHDRARRQRAPRQEPQRLPL